MSLNAVFLDFKRDEMPSSFFKRLERLFSSICFATSPPPIKELSGTDVIFSKVFTKIDRNIINTSANLKYIGILATATDTIDIAYASSKNITICNLGGYSTEAVAEFFFAALLDVTRQLKKAYDQANKGNYSVENLLGSELMGKRLGVIGAGRIGSRIVSIAHGFDMKISYFSRHHKAEVEKNGAVKTDLDKILSDSDMIALVLPLTKETKNIINDKGIKSLKNGCVFISLAPLGTLDQKAMLERLENGDITFVLDHPDDIDTHIAKKLRANKNCIVYPMIGFRTHEADTTRWETFVSNIEQFVAGKPQNVVTANK